MTDAQIENNRKEYAEKLAKASAYFREGSDLLSPPVKRAAYSDRMAWIMASMAQIAYDEFEVNIEARQMFIAKLEGGGFKLIKTFNSKETDTQAFLATHNNFAVLAFRGTEVAKVVDIKTDAKAGKLATIQGEVHKGFAGAYGSVEKEIEEQVKNLNGLPLYITGHSLGAALATVCTQKLEHTQAFQEQIAACYTFGSPRVGDAHFDRDFKSPIYRMANTTDIVTVVPLLAMGYTHVGDARFLGRKEGDFKRGIPLTRRFFLFLFTVFKLFAPLVGDHSIDEYRRKLGAIAEKRNIGIRAQ
jgi:hypothetical protein